MKIAIVEDKKQYADELTRLIARYANERSFAVTIETFDDGMKFIDSYSVGYDVIFLDVKMPIMDGMETAKRIRQTDAKSCIVFVTNYAQYAINGYEVQAFDYIIKPISYGNFVIKMDRIMQYVANNVEKYIMIQKDGWMVRVNYSDIVLIESDRHNVIYYTTKGEFQERRKLSDVEKELDSKNFVRCNVSDLINLAHVDKINKDCVLIGGRSLSITRSRKESFLKSVNDYLAGK